LNLEENRGDRCGFSRHTKARVTGRLRRNPLGSTPRRSYANAMKAGVAAAAPDLRAEAGLRPGQNQKSNTAGFL
jgi:hypothetical protein